VFGCAKGGTSRFFCWAIQWENPSALRNAENQLNELITRDHNRAALIIYSVANETPISEARNRFLSHLIQQVHSSDSSRLVSAALQADETKDGNRLTIYINDPIAKELDVMGNNQYIGWYVRNIADLDITDWVSKCDKPLIMSEFGADAQFGNHGDAQARFTEEYQAALYKHQIAMLKRIS
jgi:beta-glucuronidase